MNEDTPTERRHTASTPLRDGFAPGQRVFGRYTLEVQVGRGGMGVVWRARDEKLERSVALKFLPPEVASDVEAVRDLKLETRRCLDLTHTNIVRVYDFVEEGAHAAIAMEFIEGVSLAKLKTAAPGGCLGSAELSALVSQLCAALSYAHQVGRVVHHDLKPANVLVTNEGVLKVTDFGIARSLSETQTRHTGKTSGSGSGSGTVLYMSPQQLAGEKPTAADDIYALGATLYELLTGKPPFFRGDAVSVRQQAIERSPTPLEIHRAEVGCSGPEIPARWSETILKCLAKRPEDRPGTATEVAVRLGLMVDSTTGKSLTFSTDSGTGASSEAAPTGAGSPRSLVSRLLAGGVLLLAASAAAIYFGIYVPEQKRLAEERERARVAEVRLQAERARRAEEIRVAEEQKAAAERARDEAAKAQAAKDQQAYSAILARIAALSDNSLQAQVTEVQRLMRAYLDTAPEQYRVPVQKAWADRQAARAAVQAANRPGTVLIETDPAGATVVLYPRNDRKISPAIFEDVKPGDVSLRVEKEGYEPRDIPLVVKPGVANKVEPVRLVATYGSLSVTSDPPDMYVSLDGNGRHLEGRTPFNPGLLPPGAYKVSFQRPTWQHPVVKSVTVERGKTATVSADMRGFSFEIRSDPPGAQLAIDGHLYERGKIIKADSAEPKEYQITATMEGYETFSKTINLTKNQVLVATLVEKQLPKALRRMTGVHWHSESFSVTADLTFNAQGRVTGTHRVLLSEQGHDAGTAESFNSATNTFLVKFTPGQPKPFYGSDVQMQLVDDATLAVTWKADGETQQLIFHRAKTAKK